MHYRRMKSAFLPSSKRLAYIDIIKFSTESSVWKYRKTKVS
uniref:Uncharacterized protein n=1 Tax=Vibrio splendidus TaxID=29497 RepID=A0A0H3ZMQ3_VIBSP|nr:hypothetical protein [Vibrio splendidus]